MVRLLNGFNELYVVLPGALRESRGLKIFGLIGCLD
jgi:hypothetical protein